MVGPESGNNYEQANQAETITHIASDSFNVPKGASQDIKNNFKVLEKRYKKEKSEIKKSSQEERKSIIGNSPLSPGVESVPAAQFEINKGGVDHKTFQKNLRTEIKKIEIDIQTLQQKGVDNGGMSQEDMMTLFSLMNTKEGLNQTLQNSMNKQQSKGHETIEVEQEELNQIHETIEVEQEELNQIHETIKKLTAIETILGKNILKKHTDIDQLLQQAKQEGIDESTRQGYLDKILSLLKNEDKYIQIAQDFSQESPEKYQQFKEFLIKEDPSFEPFILKIEQQNDFSNHTLKPNQENLFTQNLPYEKNGSHIIVQGDNGENITYNTADMTRSLSLDDSKYSFKKNIPEFDISDIEAAYSDEENELQDTQSKLKNAAQLVEEYGDKNTEELITRLQNLGVEVGQNSSVEDIKETIRTQFQENKEEMKDLQVKKQTSIDQYIQQYQNLLSQEDKEQKEILNFISDLGFDEIPQSITNTIFAQLNAGKTRINLGSNLSITKVDMANLEFEGEGISMIGKEGVSNLQNREILAKIMNKIITGDENYPVDITSISSALGGRPTYKDPNKPDTIDIGIPGLRNLITQNLGTTKLAGDPLQRAMDNIWKDKEK